MTAMSWNLFQQIANYIIFYGSNIIEVYTNLLRFAQRQLGIQTDIVWLPIIILLIVYALFGLLSAVIGIRTGRKMLSQPAAGIPGYRNKPVEKIPEKSVLPFNYSIAWLIADVALIIVSFVLLSRTSWIVWSLVISAIIIIWSLRYKRALRQLSKPKFWIFFVLITLLTTFAFTKAQDGENLLLKGLLTGFQMNFRAAIIILGFSVLGTELYNPVIRNYFLRTSFKNLPLALELSVESLPLFIANIPDFKTLVKNPVSIFYQVISQADKRLTEIMNKTDAAKKVFIITGHVGEGKTTFVKKLIDFFIEKNIKAGGILSERVLTGSKTTGYDLLNIETGEKEAFLRETGESGSDRIGRFTICQKGLTMGISILKSLALKKDMLIIIDEVGSLELRNMGWSECLDDLTGKSDNPLIMTVRSTLVDEVIKKWNLEEPVVYNVSEVDYLSAGLAISKHIIAN
jgi:nucleoside-triphosphatase THEP1